MKRIVVVSAGLSVPSSTRLLADMLGDAAVDAIHDRGQDADHLLTGFPTGELKAAIDKVRRTDGLVVVTPVFSASYSGLFKTFFDVLEVGVLDGKPVVVAATAGTARHSLVLDHALRPLFSYLHAVVVPTGVFAASEDFGAVGGDAGTGDLAKRVNRAANELAALVAGPGDVPRPVHHRRSVDEEFASPTSFEDLLRAASDGPPEY